MLSRTACDRVAAIIRSASASTETRFLDIGSRLGTAVDTIETLTRTFDLLAGEMRGESLRDATHELSQVMSRVSALTRNDNDERNALEQLAELTAKIQQRVVRMAQAVKDIGMLKINVQIEAVSIGDAGLEFAGFTNDMGRTLRLAQDSLNQLTKELVGVSDHLRTAAASRLAFVQNQTAAVRSIPVKLAASVGAIGDHGKRAAATALTVAQKSGQVGQRISNVVMALQIGDITRQRLEHVEYALGILAGILTPQPGAWSELSESQRHALAALCCKVQSAQLLDAADQFDHEMHQILSSLQELAADAREILRLGNTVVGASNGHRGTFLHEIEGQVEEVNQLLDGLKTARKEADHVAVSVTEATTRLASHTSDLSTLEEDIRIMGLNTTLKCGRLGASGRPLIVIAQELRIYANQIAMEANAVTASLDRLLAIAGALLDNDQEERATRLVAIGDGMANSVSRLGTAGQSLTDALATLAHDSEAVAGLLRDTVDRATVHEELSQALRQAVTDLAGATADIGAETDITTPEADRMLDLFLCSYTMDRERMVHARHSNGRSGGLPTAPVAPAPVDLDEFIF
jgi:hypothetical protein